MEKMQSRLESSLTHSVMLQDRVRFYCSLCHCCHIHSPPSIQPHPLFPTLPPTHPLRVRFCCSLCLCIAVHTHKHSAMRDLDDVVCCMVVCEMTERLEFFLVQKLASVNATLCYVRSDQKHRSQGNFRQNYMDQKPCYQGNFRQNYIAQKPCSQGNFRQNYANACRLSVLLVLVLPSSECVNTAQILPYQLGLLVSHDCCKQMMRAVILTKRVDVQYDEAVKQCEEVVDCNWLCGTAVERRSLTGELSLT